MNAMITYEQPLNEIIRVCMRLEQLFEQVDHQLPDTSELGTRNLISYIINILHLLDRPDLKAKLAKELTHHLSSLKRHRDHPDADIEKLNELITQLEDMSRTLIDSSGKIGYRLRDIELMNTLRLHMASPGGGCSFDVPIFYYWLEQPEEQRTATIKEWLSDFDQIRTATSLVLYLVRKSAKSETKTAVHGFHQELLDPQLNLRMLRISIDRDLQTFPETSVGRHFLSVRFFVPDINKRPVQYNENLDFVLDYCH